jgi:FtsP/CotA-like multicopper oxidase with cupredoxin domain
MSTINFKRITTMKRLLPLLMMALILMVTVTAHAAAPGITGPTFDLVAKPNYISQPDGQMIYSWGYGCNTAPTGYLPSAITSTFCNDMQVPGPTLIVNEGDTVTVKLTNMLPAAAGSTSILFPGFSVTATGGTAGVLTTEAGSGSSVTYKFTATTPGTRAYYSGTQGDLQVEMGLYGAIIVLPTSGPTGGSCPHHNTAVESPDGTTSEGDFRNSITGAAFHNVASCYDREYLFQFSEIDPRIHQQAIDQVQQIAACVSAADPNVKCATSLDVATEPYHPAYFMINGRSMPDDMDTNYAQEYPHQPYNGNPHMHPGDLTLLRVIGQGRWQHPFHEHGNHVRILARDGNAIMAPNGTDLAGPLLFTTTTTPGLAMDGIFYWTGKGLNWDVLGHGYSGDASVCKPDANGYYTNLSGAPDNAPNYYEWCQDHNLALEANPFGQVAAGGPVTLPDANILTNGAWYGGSAYLGPDATARATGSNGTTPPSGTISNSPSSESGYAYMWHSHNEREITTSNIFPGGMMMMMLVDPRAFPIDESK